MQRLEVSGAVRPIYGSLGVKRLISYSVDCIMYIAHFINQGQHFFIHIMPFVQYLDNLRSNQQIQRHRKLLFGVATTEIVPKSALFRLFYITHTFRYTQPVGILSTGDQSVAQATTYTTPKKPKSQATCPRRNSNPCSQKSRVSRHTLQIARLLGSDRLIYACSSFARSNLLIDT